MKSKTKKIITIAVLAVIIIALAVSILTQKNNATDAKWEQFEMQSQTLRSVVVSSAVVVTDNIATISTPVAGDIAWKVEDGETVKEKDVVAMMGAYSIKAPFDGEVMFLCEDSESLKAGDAVFKIIDFEGMEMQGNVSEKDISKLSIGQEVEITMNSSFDIYTGVITSIDKEGVNVSGTTHYVVKTTIEGESRDQIFLGMNGDIKVETGKVENAVTAELSKIIFQGEKAYVLVKNTDGEMVQQEIEVGFSDGFSIEVKSLPAGTVYYFEAETNQFGNFGMMPMGR